MSRLLSLVFALSACESERPARAPQKQETVPANSLDESRLHGTNEKSAPAKEDPTQPRMTKVGEAAPPPAPSAVSKTDCGKVMDKYIELEIATTPQLKGVPAEVIERAKQAAKEQHGDAPCTASPEQYACAMAATTTKAWQKCLK